VGLRPGPYRTELRWEIAPPHAAAAGLAEALAVDPLVAQVLINRGYDTPDRARRFLDPPLEALEDPDQIVDMPAAADRIARAVRDREPMSVYGDYDADGITATAILLRGLRGLGGEVAFYVPSRFREGYGLHDAALRQLAADGRRLVVAVDCGITATAEVARAVERDQDIIVVDHHEPGPALPPARAVVDPKRRDGGAAFTEYAAAGLAFQLLRAVRRRLDQPEVPVELLDLAALGTIADVVPLVADNRIIARWGLQRLRSAPCPGLAALVTVAGLGEEVTARHVGFALAPRLNAAGRLGDASAGVRLLTTDDPVEAGGIAAQLDAENRQRRDLCDQIFAEAVERVESTGLQRAPAIVLAGDGWHPGVIGIVASQLVERYYRPAVLLAVAQGRATGSARSIARFHLVDALAQCADLLERFGGHAMAAGLTMTAERIPAFSRRFGEVAASRLTPADLVPRLAVDAEIPLAAVTGRVAEQLQHLAPFGVANPEPVFAARGLTAVRTRVLGDGQHLRLGVTDGQAFAEAIGFRLGDASELLAFTRAKIDLAFTVGLDRWDEQPRVQMFVEDLVTPDLDLSEVLTDGRLLIERLFTRAEDYLGDDALGLEEAGAFYTKVAGVTFEGRQDAVRHLLPGEPLTLRREPGNPHDPHAVKVVTGRDVQIGYLSARVASRLAPSMDSGTRYTATVSQITGGGDRSYGVNIYVRRQETPADEPVHPQPLQRAQQEVLTEALIARIARQLHRGRPLRDAHLAAIRAVCAGGSVRGVFGPGRGRRAVIEIAAAAWVIAGRGAVIIAVPMQSEVDRWYERLAPRLREIGVRCGRAHGALRFRERQGLLQSLRSGEVDVLMASLEYLRQADAGGASPALQWLRPSLLLMETEPTIGSNIETALGAGFSHIPRAIFSSGGDSAAAPLPSDDAGPVVSDQFVRVNLRLVDRRGTRDRDTALTEICGRGEKTLVYAGPRRAAVDLATRLRGAGNGHVAYYHAGLPLRVREVLEQLFADGRVTVLVASDGWTADAAAADVRQVLVAGLPAHRGELAEVVGSAGLDGRQATVTLLYGPDDLPAVEAGLAKRHPPRETLAALYNGLRAAVGQDGAASWPDDALAAALQPAGVTAKTIGIGLDILAEAGVIQREYDGERWRITLPEVGRRDLTASVRFAEGRREAEALADLRAWAFGPLTEILRAVAGPGTRRDRGPETGDPIGEIG